VSNTDKAINNDREFVAQIIRSLPGLDSKIKQMWIENPENLKRVLKEALAVELVVPKHTIDLSVPPRLPYNGAEVVNHLPQINGKKTVTIELRSDDNLYIDGRKVELFLPERQKGNNQIEGHELRTELANREWILLNSNVLDYLYDHPKLFPEHWKKDENKKIRYIFFWGSVFRHPSSGRLCVRYLYYCLDSVSLKRHFQLYGNLTRQCPSASVASK